MRQGGIDFPSWLFTWPVLLIALGLLGAIKHNFRPGGWYVLLAVGGIFLADRLIPGTSIRNFAWPCFIIAAGLWMIVKPKNYQKHFRSRRKRNRADEWYGNALPDSNAGAQSHSATADDSDFIESSSFFGGVKKIVLSKNFKGGDISNVMGGTEINLTQADIQNKIVIDTTNIFGGTVLIMPPTWDVQSDVLTIFGGVDDKRQITAQPLQPNKIVVLTGLCIFGGIEIKSF
jgi:predicted membrane protein